MNDQLLTPAALSALYPAGFPGYPVSYWRDQVTSGHTLLGYWDWVVEQLRKESE